MFPQFQVSRSSLSKRNPQFGKRWILHMRIFPYARDVGDVVGRSGMTVLDSWEAGWNMAEPKTGLQLQPGRTRTFSSLRSGSATDSPSKKSTKMHTQAHQPSRNVLYTSKNVGFTTEIRLLTHGICGSYCHLPESDVPCSDKALVVRAFTGIRLQPTGGIMTFMVFIADSSRLDVAPTYSICRSNECHKGREFAAFYLYIILINII